MSTEKVNEITAKLLKMFEEGTFPASAARTFISRQTGEDRPSLHWSLGNQIIMLLSDTEDARGFRQWHDVDRVVTKGSKAIYILAPLTRKVEINVTASNGQEHVEERRILHGFRAVPVFRLEDTEGEPLPQVDYDPPEFPPLYEVACHFGIVSYQGKFSSALGSCSTKGDIKLNSYDVDVFWHELGHSVHNTIKPLKGGQHEDQEIVAEMTACIMCELYGFEGYLWHGWEYLKYYADQDAQKALRKIMQLLGEVEAVVTKILSVNNALRLGETEPLDQTA
jgi:hypothetical protein